MSFIDGRNWVRASVDDEGGRWVTVKGTHVFIKEGETTEEAFEKTTGKKLITSHVNVSEKLWQSATEVKRAFFDVERDPETNAVTERGWKTIEGKLDDFNPKFHRAFEETDVLYRGVVGWNVVDKYVDGNLESGRRGPLTKDYMSTSISPDSAKFFAGSPYDPQGLVVVFDKEKLAKQTKVVPVTYVRAGSINGKFKEYGNVSAPYAVEMEGRVKSARVGKGVVKEVWVRKEYAEMETLKMKTREWGSKGVKVKTFE